jgi:hypothetical protein
LPDAQILSLFGLHPGALGFCIMDKAQEMQETVAKQEPEFIAHGRAVACALRLDRLERDHDVS